MLDQGIGSWPKRRARMSPHRTALVEHDRATTYAGLEHRANELANGLRARGVTRGDRVAYLGLNSTELVVAMFAVAKLGAVFLPMNTRLTPPELGFMLKDSAARILLRDRGFEDATSSGDLDGVPLEVIDFQSGDDGAFAALVNGASGAELDEPIGHDDLFMIQYTSGTTGRPKGVMLTHGNITWNVLNLVVDVDIRADEVSLVTAPLFHTAALNQILLPTLLKGGTAIIERKFDPDRVLDLVESHQVTLLFGVASMYMAIAGAPRWAEADLSSIRTTLSGGAPLPEALLRTWLTRGLPVLQGYGLTEASPGVTMLRAESAVSKLGSAGTACFFTDVRVVRADLEDAPVGEPGEVLVSGPHVTPGYWQNPGATREAFVGEGWLRTGDLAVVDDDGFVTIVDRVKDMFISGGENVYPAEVEQAIHSHPAVAECAVIGVDDARWGEVGRAVVVVRAGEQLDESTLLDHLRARLAGYKVPKSVLFVDDLPHNATGKLLKPKVRDLYAAPTKEGK